jgi:hypothetical protein
MKIKQTREFYPSHRTGTLTNVSIDEVNKILGFSATESLDAGDGKVTVEWRFKATVPCDIPMAGPRDMPCAIWDYKGSLSFNQLSVWMPPEVGTRLFGANYTSETQY